MNQSYTLHDDTAERLHRAALCLAALIRPVNSERAADLEAAAGTLAAQNQSIEE